MKSKKNIQSRESSYKNTMEVETRINSIRKLEKREEENKTLHNTKIIKLHLQYLLVGLSSSVDNGTGSIPDKGEELK